MTKTKKSPPNIILSGASGVGKTTLALELAKEFGYDFIKTNTKELEIKHGGREKINKFQNTRMEFQLDVAKTTSRMLYEGLQNWIKHSKIFVADRGIDFLMYECVYGGSPNKTLQHNWIQGIINVLRSDVWETKIIILCKDEDDYLPESDLFDMSENRYYHINKETLKQEIAMEVVLRLLGIPYEKVKRKEIDVKIKNPIRQMIEADD